MKKKSFLLILLFLLSGTFCRLLAQSDTSVIHQLRIYEIPKQNREVFHTRFRDHAKRIMEKYGFPIVAIWESVTTEKIEFVYLLEWKNKQFMEQQWAKFMADKEWQDIKKETAKQHGVYVDSIQDRTLLLTDYSPAKRLLPE